MSDDLVARLERERLSGMPRWNLTRAPQTYDSQLARAMADVEGRVVSVIDPEHETIHRQMNRRLRMVSDQPAA